VGDQHTNSTVGLSAPAVNLDDGGTYHLNRTQQWLWHCWLEIWQDFASVPAVRKIVVWKGDTAELDTKRRSVQLISINKATVFKLLIRTMEPALDVADANVFIRGTQAHVGRGAWIEETIADDCTTAIRDKEHGTASWYQCRPVIDGVRFDLSHHAGLGRRWWTKNTSAAALAAEVAIDYIVGMGQPPPNIVSRSHNHRLAEGTADTYNTLVQVQYTPAWTTATEFAYRSGFENKYADIGAVMWLIKDGQYERRILRFKPDTRRIWAMKI